MSFQLKLALKPCSIDVSRNFLSNALVNVSNGRLEPELWHFPDSGLGYNQKGLERRKAGATIDKEKFGALIRGSH